MRPGPFHASLHSRHVRQVVALLLAVAMLVYGSGGALLAAKGPTHHHRDDAPHGHLHFAMFSWKAMVHEGLSQLLGAWTTTPPMKAARVDVHRTLDTPVHDDDHPHASTRVAAAQVQVQVQVQPHVPPHSPLHFHGDTERHHHDARDGSVVVDADPHASDGSTLLAALSLPIAPPVQALRLPSPRANGRWQPAASDRWDDASLPLLRRPPRV
ncbi:MAG: hypothetical protein J7598_02270 [Mitsuaria chitosanitabida]|uniref:hypothetical protein n=1 Tax=Roseateles chitosanitabidus TaxID=65048 RepID=UPI001AFD55DE|nr:hypothetical protein [Roseateles chitosanitabidus]MBO9685414.1 hypothetical protein [Roseateles chitosanitabidus]